ncbi:hypothetical protein V8F06_011253 [Rhypophila decipiens]
MATPAAQVPSLEDTWKLANIQREAIAKELQKIQDGGQGANETARFEKVEKLMQNLRLNCVGMIFLETRAADEMGVEDLLWFAHTIVTSAYRKVIGQLQTSDRAVLKRKVEKLYFSYLKTANGFYRGFLQRLCSLYDIKELKRIARLTELEDMKTLEGGKADMRDGKLQKIAIGMCHKILVHIGDFARYRTLARAKDRRWDAALTYYALANELIPESGFGYHQAGVIYTETEDHLQVVYHFYRAFASEEPHPMALKNLEREFHKLRDGKARGRRGGSNDAMVAWFVKLHAHYFKGEKFTSRKELEDEVDARLAMALKKGTQTEVDTDLLKMVLINILAYQVGLDKIRTQWTDSGSLSCQFILLQNVRTIQTITRLLREELIEFVQREPVKLSTGSTGQNDESGKYSPTFHRVLPLLRVYMTWLCFSSTDLVGYKDHLEPHFGQMCKMLANALNLLFELVSTDSDIANVQKRATWRLPEDEETLGMKCLNGPGLPEGSQLCYDPIDRTPKPRLEEVKDAKPTADTITLTRALDVILCALELANHSPFPIEHSKTLDGSQEQKFFYTENAKSRVIPHKLTDKSEAPAAPVSTRSVSTTTASALQEPLKVAPAIETAANDSEDFSEDQEFYSGSAKKHRSLAALIPSKDPASKPQATNSSEFSLDHELFKILNDFLVPPETEPVVKSQEPPANVSIETESSYGMGSTTANEVFGSLAPASPTPGSATARAFPTLPWNYFNIPAPVEGGVRSASGSSSVWAQTYGQPRSRPGTSSNALPNLNPEGETKALAYCTSSQSQNRNSVHLSPMLSGFRASPSQQTRSVVMPAVNPNEHTGQTMNGSGVRNVWPNSAGSNVSPADPWSSPAGRWDLGQHASAHQAVPQSPFSSLAFSGINSSLPPVNSPWGVPMRASETAFAQGTGHTPLRADSAQSPSNFGNGSPYTPIAQPNTGITQGPPPGFGVGNGVASNVYGSNYAARQPGGGGGGWGTPQSETHEGVQVGLNARLNGHQPRVMPPPGFAPSTGRRGGSTDLSKAAAGLKTKQQQGIMAIREPFGPGANGRTGFNVPKR